MKGISDILALKNGEAYFLEVKGEKGKPSPDQVEFGRLVKLAGSEYHTVKSIDDVQAIGL